MMKISSIFRVAISVAILGSIALSGCTSESEYLKMKNDPNYVEAEKLLRKGKNEKALKKLEEALKTNPNNPYARYKKAIFTAETDPDNALSEIKSAISDMPSTDSAELTSAYTSLASILSEVNLEYGKAADAYEKAYSYSHRPSLLLEQANCLFLDDDTKQALKLFDQATGDKPLAQRASCKYKLGMVDEAIEEVVSVCADTVSAEATLLLFEIAEGNREKVEDALAKASAKRPKNIMLHILTGDMKAQRDAFAEAIEAYSAAGELAPKNGDIDESIAECHYELGEFGKALESINKAIDKAKDRETKNRLKERRAQMTEKGSQD